MDESRTIDPNSRSPSSKNEGNFKINHSKKKTMAKIMKEKEQALKEEERVEEKLLMKQIEKVAELMAT